MKLKNYVVAIYCMYQSKLSQYKVLETNKLSALRQAMVEYAKATSDQYLEEWVERQTNEMSYETLVNELGNQDKVTQILEL